MRIRVSGTHFPLETLGPGRRLGIWLQGCPLACPGCMSRHTWDAEAGESVDVETLLELWRSALGRGAAGMTVSGGEPLAQPAALAELLRGAARLRTAWPRPGTADDGLPADLLVYTGYEESELDTVRRAALASADAVVTGRFRVAEPTGLVWRGSANQRLTPRTGLGRVRYAPHLDREADGPAVQIVVESAREADGPAGPPAVRLLGVPRRGELLYFERWLRERGLRLRERSWRP
ncbi:4Fe-4S single cluster domain-containing protein [Streptomyces sp. NBC_00893]|uniref:4Fe-4S single cluster domain-containing protein n=1 Tax=Streptomyces sp. NBC_00893 TaxID=2975862 RepID=UPI00225BFF7E|nr:4Fe-4S single cluster domain-containing protein [Streptomyces sp. NBC_00893]MCX4846845.1 radical SAM protein [Streptomyces sp. NBC_00893]